MIARLLGVRVQMVLYAIMKRSSGKRRAPLLAVALAVLGVYLLAVLALLFGIVFKSMAVPFHRMGIDWLYFCMVLLGAFALMFIGNIFMAQSQIYDAKDNELLLALPVKPSAILVSRLLLLYLTSLIYELPVMGAGVLMYAWEIAADGRMLAVMLLFYLLLPLTAIAVSCTAGAAVAAVGTRMKHRTIFTVLLFLLLFGLYLYGYSKLNTLLAAFVAQGEQMAEGMKAAVLPLYHMGRAAMGTSARYLFYSVLYLTIPFALMYLVLAKCFVKLASTPKRQAAVRYRRKRMRASGARAALLKREWKRFSGNPWYVLNGAIGMILIVAAAAAVLIKPDLLEPFRLLVNGEEQMQVICLFAVCAVIGTNIISAPSVSLEGKRLWIVKSCPVEAKTVLAAKAKFHFIVLLPAVLAAGTAMNAVFHPTAVMRVLFFALPALNALFGAVWGVAVNLHFPRLDFISEVAVIKNSASSMICVLVQMAAGACAGAGLLLEGVLGDLAGEPYLIFYGGLLGCAAAAVGYWLMRGGARRFEELC